MDLSGTWRAAAADEGLRRRYFQTRRSTTGRGPNRRARPLAVEPGVRRPRRPAALPARLRRAPRRPTGGVAGWCSTASSTRATCGSTAPTSATPRATSSRTPSRSPTRPARPHRARARRRGGVRTARPTAPPSATSPACSSTGTASTPTGTRAASGGRCGSRRPGPVRIRRLARAVPPRPAPTARRARRSGPCSTRPRPAPRRCAPTVGGDGRRTCRTQPLAAGENQRRVDGHRRPARRCGGRTRSATSRCYDVAVEVGAATGELSHRAAVRTGLRQVRMRNWIATVNGERLFLKGSNQGPTRMALGRGDARRAATATCAGQGRRPRPAARARPRQPARALRRRPTRPACCCGRTCRCSGATPAACASRRRARPREAVDLLGHHPSIAIWCGHNEPMALDLEPGGTSATRRAWRPRSSPPSSCRRWNKTSSTAPIKRALEQADGTRPVIAHSGRAPPPAAARRHRQPPLLRLVPRRRARPPALLRRRARAWPASSPSSARRPCPTTADFCEPERWPDLDWDAARPHATRCRRRIFDQHVPPADYATFDELARRDAGATRPTVVRYHIETLRRLKYRPTGGFCQFCFADGHPAVTWSVLDHDACPKAGYQRPGRGVRAGDRGRRPPRRVVRARRRRSPSTSTS